MEKLEDIAERIRTAFDAQTIARDRALARARTLTRHCSQAIRAIHRADRELARTELEAARLIVSETNTALRDYPDLYYAGYTQDAFKEYAEAAIVVALLTDQQLPEPEDLGIEFNTYLRGLAETSGELRRRCLDILRDGYSEDAEKLLEYMDDIYAVLVTMDYPDAITGGLRRLTDITRSINERTRGDLTLNQRQSHLERALRELQIRLDELDRD
ncbi:MAG: haloacid dehalogenase [Anaerolineales bacterium]|jgi:translin